MNIGLGVYDIFSRIVPGGFYLLVFYQLAVVLGWIKIDLTTFNEIGIVPSIGLIVLAYILGTGMGRVASVWHRIFKKRGMSDRVLDKFKEENMDWQFIFKAKDWPILRAYIRLHNPEIANVIDRNNALSIMLRNISLGLVLLAFTEGIQFVNTMNWIYILLVALLIFFSYQIAIQARDLQDWFYHGIFQTIIAYRLDLEERVKPVNNSAKRKNAK